MNPLIERYRSSHRHAHTYGVLAGLYLVTVVLAIIGAIPRQALLGLNYWWPIDWATTLYAELWVVQVALWLWAALQTSGTIPKEVERKSYDLFRLLPLSPQQKAVGLTIGVNLPLLIFIAINLGISTLVQPLSARSFDLHIELQLLTVGAGVLLNALALFTSVLATGKTAGGGAGSMVRRAVMLVGLMTVAGSTFVFARVMASTNDEPSLAQRLSFFGVATPAFVVIFIFLCFFCAWVYGATLRRLRLEDQPAVSRMGGTLFLGSFSVVVLGSFAEKASYSVFGEWLAIVGSTLPLLLIVMAASRGTSDSSRKGSALEQASNLVTATQLAVITVLSWVLAAIWLGIDTHRVFAIVSMVVVTYAFIALTLEAVSLLEPIFSQSVLVGGFVMTIYALFPAIVSLTTQRGAYVFSGLDYLVVLLTSSQRTVDQAQLSASLFVNASYCVALFAIVGILYRRNAV